MTGRSSRLGTLTGLGRSLVIAISDSKDARTPNRSMIGSDWASGARCLRLRCDLGVQVHRNWVHQPKLRGRAHRRRRILVRMLSQQPFPAGLGPEDFLRHMADLRNETPVRVRHQHVVSQVVLRRFSAVNHNGGRELRAVALEYGRSRRCGVAGCGAVDDFVPVASGSAEQLWQEVETKLGDAVDAAEAGTVFSRLEQQEVIKSAVALHFIRSMHMLLMHYQALGQVWHRLRSAAVGMAGDLLRKHFPAVTGIHAAGAWALEAAFDDLAGQRIDEFLDGWGFRSRIEQNYARVRDWLAFASVQLLRAPSELYIGDAPVVLAAAGRTRHGLAGGLGLIQAEEIFMPMTSRLAVRLSADGKGYVDIGAAEVERLNVLQLGNAYRYLYAAPLSPVDAFVKRYRSAWRRPESIESARDTVLRLQRKLPHSVRTRS